MGRGEFLAWYETLKSHPFHNKKDLEAYGEDNVMVLRQAGRVFRREFLQIANMELFLQYLIIATACNKVLRCNF